MDEDEAATFGVTIGDYYELLPTSAVALSYDQETGDQETYDDSNCTQEIKQVSLEMQPLRKNPIYIKVTSRQGAIHECECNSNGRRRSNLTISAAGN